MLKKFTNEERVSLLNAHMVGPTVVTRLEEIGLGSFESLKKADAKTVNEMVALHLGSSCWTNSPHARTAIKNAIKVAQDS